MQRKAMESWIRTPSSPIVSRTGFTVDPGVRREELTQRSTSKLQHDPQATVGFHLETTSDWAHRLEHAAFEIDLGAPGYISGWNTRTGLDLLKVSRDPIEFEGVLAMIHLRGPAANMRQRTYGPSNGRGE